MNETLHSNNLQPENVHEGAKFRSPKYQKR